ncbi:MAG: hypothetical protein KDE51_12515 [Anaerolineales bacterium]|nr:hypothetical protein [Anaerolineales bacterium]
MKQRFNYKSIRNLIVLLAIIFGPYLMLRPLSLPAHGRLTKVATPMAA